ncbi:MAG TPA: trigger factor [Spirochaetota bacterium]|nr:trigger factor [Spirochaetota bacterium]
MQISEKKLENATYEFQITVPENTVEIEYKSVFDRIQKNARIDGFRKGKAPLGLIEQRFRAEADAEVAENILRTVYGDALIERKLMPVGRPSFEFDGIKKGEPFSFKVTFEVAPTVEIAPYTGLPVEQRASEITEKDVDREIETMREQNATIQKKEADGTVENGNLVKFLIKRIDNIDPAEVEAAEFKEYSIIVGKSKEEHTIDRDILGMKVDETREAKVKYPKKYEVEDLAGQKVTYLVKIVEISTMTLPELNDEFAKDMGEYATYADLRKDVRDYLTRFTEIKSKGEAKQKLLVDVIEKSSFEIPGTMIESEVGAVYRRMLQRMGMSAESVSLEDFAKATGTEVSALKDQLRPEALKSIKSMIALLEIAKRENITVDPAKYREVVESLAKRNNATVEQMEEMVEERQLRENIETEIIMESALELLYEKAQVKRLKAVPLTEFMKAGDKS